MRHCHEYTKDMLRPPGPRPHFLIGNIPLAAAEPLNTFARWANEFGDIFYYRAAWLHVYFLNRPDLIEYVLVRNPQNFLKDRVVQSSRWLLGTGLLTAEGEPWKRQRRILQPAFSRDRVNSYSQCMINCAEQMLATWKPGTVIDIHQEMMRVTLRVVIQALFGVETAETNTISQAMNTVMANSTGARLLLPPLFRYLPFPGMRNVRRAAQQMNAGVYHIVRQRHSRDAGAPLDLLSILMNARDDDGSGMTDEQVRDEVMTFLLAGHETTALALCWGLYLLSRHPEVEQKLHDELDLVLGSGPPHISNLPLLVYTEKVLKETMRLYPPAWSVARTAIDGFELESYRIPARSNIVMSQWIMHRDARFFPDPQRFDPDRWDTASCQNLPRFAYFPFGGGPRQCIGSSFATTEALLLLATIARKFRLVNVNPSTVVPVPSLTLRPKGSIPMRIESRH